MARRAGTTTAVAPAAAVRQGQKARRAAGEPVAVPSTYRRKRIITLVPAKLDHAARRESVTATDIVALCGESHYKSALDVFLEKRGLTASFATKSSVNARVGLELEPLAMRLFTEATGLRAMPGVRGRETYRHPVRKWAAATPDRILHTDPRWVLEIKTTEEHNAQFWSSDQWSDAAPQWVRLQQQWQCYVTGAVGAYTTALIGFGDVRFYVMDRDDAVIEACVELGARFRENVKKNIPPDMDPEMDDITKWLRATAPAQTTEVLLPAPPEIEEAYARLVEARVEAEMAGIREARQREVIQVALKTAPGFTLSNGHRVTWKAGHDRMVLNREGILSDPRVKVPLAVLAENTATVPATRAFRVYRGKDPSFSELARQRLDALEQPAPTPGLKPTRRQG